MTGGARAVPTKSRWCHRVVPLHSSPVQPGRGDRHGTGLTCPRCCRAFRSSGRYGGIESAMAEPRARFPARNRASSLNAPAHHSMTRRRSSRPTTARYDIVISERPILVSGVSSHFHSRVYAESRAHQPEGLLCSGPALRDATRCGVGDARAGRSRLRITWVRGQRHYAVVARVGRSRCR